MCVSPQLLYDAMSLLIHHDVDAARSRVGKAHSPAERRDLAVVCCIDKLRTILSQEKANPEMFQSFEHGYVEAGWLQRLWPPVPPESPDSQDSQDGALHLLRMLAQAQLCFALDDSTERFQFPSLLPADNTVACARLEVLCPQLCRGVGSAVGVCLTRADNMPQGPQSRLGTVHGCAAMLERELLIALAQDSAAAAAAAQAVTRQLESVEQFFLLALQHHEVRHRLRVAQVAPEREYVACEAVLRVCATAYQHNTQGQATPSMLASVFPPDFVHHLQMHVVSKAIAQERLQHVVLWRDGVLFPMNLVSDLQWPPEVLVQLQVHNGDLLVAVLHSGAQLTNCAFSFEQALPVVLQDVVQAVRDAGNFTGLEWNLQMLDDVQLTLAIRSKYKQEAAQERVCINLASRLVNASPDTTLPPMPLKSLPPSRVPSPSPLTVEILLKRCGLSALAPELQEQMAIDVFMQAWKAAIDMDDMFSLFMTCLRDFDAVDPLVERFMAEPAAFEFATGILKRCPNYPANSSEQCRQELLATLAACDLQPLYRILVDVLAWNSIDMCQQGLELLRSSSRTERPTERSAFVRLFFDLLSLNAADRALMSRLLHTDIALAWLTKDVTVALWLQRGGLSALIPNLLVPMSAYACFQAWEVSVHTVDESQFRKQCLREAAAALPKVMGERSMLKFAEAMLRHCAEQPSRSSEQSRSELNAALAACDLQPLYRVFVDVLAWDTVDLCHQGLTLLRQSGRSDRSAAGKFDSRQQQSPMASQFLDLLGLQANERELMLKLLQPNTTVTVFINAVDLETDEGTLLQGDADALRTVFTVNERTFPAATTVCVPMLQAARPDDVAAVCTAVGYFFKPKLAIVWVGAHADPRALCLQEGPLTGAQLREHLQTLNADTTVLFLESCFSQNLIHDNMVFEGLVAFAFAARGQLMTPGAGKELLAKVFRAGHSCDLPGCKGCEDLRRACLARGQPSLITVFDLNNWLHFHRTQLLQDRATDVVSSLPHQLIPLCPYARAS